MPLKKKITAIGLAAFFEEVNQEFSEGVYTLNELVRDLIPIANTHEGRLLDQTRISALDRLTEQAERLKKPARALDLATTMRLQQAAGITTKMTREQRQQALNKYLTDKKD